jgi:hypothetical protein
MTQAAKTKMTETQLRANVARAKMEHLARLAQAKMKQAEKVANAKNK